MADSLTFAQSVGAIPARMAIVNLVTNERMDAQYNPTEFEEAFAAQFARAAVQGLSHQVMQFASTENVKIGLTLAFTSTNSSSGFGKEDLKRCRRFLMSMCYPRAVAGTVRSGGAPRALFVWPDLISLTCFITSVKFAYKRFSLTGAPVEMQAAVTLEEVRDALVTAEDVYEIGTERPPGKWEG